MGEHWSRPGYWEQQQWEAGRGGWARDRHTVMEYRKGGWDSVLETIVDTVERGVEFYKTLSDEQIVFKLV